MTKGKDRPHREPKKPKREKPKTRATAGQGARTGAAPPKGGKS
jgi:hypothetical protein